LLACSSGSIVNSRARHEKKRMIDIDCVELIPRTSSGSYLGETVSMNWLNYHHLLYFWTVAKTGSITAAAKELRLAHPTISAQISTLENNVGHKLFRQVGRRLELTEMGQLTYRYANDIFSLGEE